VFLVVYRAGRTTKKQFIGTVEMRDGCAQCGSLHYYIRDTKGNELYYYDYTGASPYAAVAALVTASGFVADRRGRYRSAKRGR